MKKARLAAAMLVVVLASGAGCEAPAQSTTVAGLGRVAANLAYTLTASGPAGLTFELVAEQGCPTLSAPATVNGVALTVVEPGGELVEPSSYGVPGKVCRSPRWESSAAALMPIAFGDAMALTLADSTGTLKVADPSAFSLAFTRAGSGPLRPGEKLVITGPPTVGPVVSLTMRTATSNTSSVSLLQTDGGVYEGEVPQVDAGSYEYFIGADIVVTPAECQGFTQCAISARVDSKGTIAITP